MSIPETKNPSCTVYLKKNEETNKENATKIMHQLEHTKLRDIISKIEIYFDPMMMIHELIVILI